jgi:hypothetical protein
MSQDAIDEAANALADELVDPYYEVKATVENEDLSLGDFVQVQKPDAGIDRKMRIHHITTTTDTGDESKATTVDKLLLSTRNLAREDPQKELSDIQRYNKAFQGSAMWGTVAGGVQAVDSNLEYTLSFFYPDVDFEHLVELQVKSLPYRAFSSGAAAGDDHTHDVTVTHPSHDHAIDFRNQDTPTNTSYTSNRFGSDGPAYELLDQGGISVSSLTVQDANSTEFQVNIDSSGRGHGYLVVQLSLDNITEQEIAHIEVFNEQDGTPYYENGVHPDISGFVYLRIPVDARSLAGDDVVVRVSNNTGSDFEITDTSTEVAVYQEGVHDHQNDFFDVTTETALGNTTSETSTAESAHTHPVDPGVTEFPSETASSVDVLVNGNTEATDIGTGTFETTVDLSGTLMPGAWNTITVASTTLGLLQCTAAIDVYRQVGAP